MPLKHYEHCCSTIQALASLGKIEGVIPLLHGPQPCSYQNQVGSMSCRPAQLVTAGTLVNKSDVIFGGEAGLKLQVKNLYKKYHPESHRHHQYLHPPAHRRGYRWRHHRA